MKQTEMLAALVDAAQQAPENPRLARAVAAARKRLLAKPAFTGPEDYARVLGNTARALETIADGLQWAGKLRQSNEPAFKILPVLLEQNRKAMRLLEP